MALQEQARPGVTAADAKDAQRVAGGAVSAKPPLDSSVQASIAPLAARWREAAPGKPLVNNF
ncbi:hypothetical protein [Actinoplanes sp. TFC3]|uniref:hypothetical protein n=1 Tax=Actinoplanes sp. TFC3 TaxID=1710355 RepID=UPI000AB9EC6C|nr:hypothetical protein [Actinoplanes sp. TFC3]